MFIEECKDPAKWEKFILENQSFNFMQSYWWGQVMKNEGKEVEYWELYGNKKDIQGMALVQRKKGVRGKFTFLESLWGPVWLPSLSSFEINSVLEDFCHYLSEKKNDVFWRLSPPTGVLIASSDLESDVSCRFFPSLALTRPPKWTLYIDLNKSLDEIMGRMKPKTRYNIRLAGRKNLRVVWGDDTKKIKQFWQLLKTTSERDKFRLHPFEHYKNLFTTKSPGSPAKMEVGLVYYGKKLLASVILLCFGRTVYYLHGASSSEHRNMMAPYLAHWEAIKRAKEKGYRFYDFWGVDSKMWPGVTRFKEGFGGKDMDYPDLYELPISPYKYKAYRLVRSIRR